MPSLSHASRMFSDRRDLFYLPIVTSGGKAAGPGAGKGIPAPKNAAPRPGPPPVAAPAQAPAHGGARARARAHRRPGNTRAGRAQVGQRCHRRGYRTRRSTAASRATGTPPFPHPIDNRAQSQPRIAIVFLDLPNDLPNNQPHTKPIHPTSTTYPHSPQSSPSRASARSPRPPPTEEAVTSPNQAPSPSPDRSEARISKTQKTPSRGPSIERNPTRLLESLYRLPTSAASPRLTRTRAPTTDGASPHR